MKTETIHGVAYTIVATLGLIGFAVTNKGDRYHIWYFTQSGGLYSIHCRKTDDRAEFRDIERLYKYLSNI